MLGQWFVIAAGFMVVYLSNRVRRSALQWRTEDAREPWLRGRCVLAAQIVFVVALTAFALWRLSGVDSSVAKAATGSVVIVAALGVVLNLIRSR